MSFWDQLNTNNDRKRDTKKPAEDSYDPAPDKHRGWVKELYREFENICYRYRIKLRPILIDLNQSKQQLGSWDPLLQKITISTYLIENYDWSIVAEVFKHEIAHKIVSDVYKQDEVHGPYFAKACELIAVEPWARRAAVDIDGTIVHWKEQKVSTEQARLLRLTEKLLALAASSNEHEALSAMNKVRQLYEKNQLDQVLKTEIDDYVSLLINHKKKRIEPYQTKICSVLGSHFFTRIIFSDLYDAELLTTHKTIEVMGTKENVLMAEYVYWFLTNNLRDLWKVYQKSHNKKGIAARNSYYLGVLCGFDEKLSRINVEPVKNETADKTNDRQLIAIGKKQLDVFVHRRHPKLQNRSWGGRTTDASSYFAGKEDGLSLNLNKGIHHSSGNQGKMITQ